MLFDVRGIWDIAGRHFAECFLSAALLTNLIYVRSSTLLSFFRAILAGVAMTALAIVTLPLSIWLVGLISLIIPNVSALPSLTLAGLIVVLLIFALMSALFQSALLRRLKHRVTAPGFWLLVLLNAFCLALASAWTYVHTGPVVAFAEAAVRKKI
jgi:hypothetical protein